MLVKEICRLGYFDKVIVDGYVLPLYNDLGIEVKQNQSIINALENNNQAFSQGIARLRISISGEVLNTESTSEINRMRRHRERELGLRRCLVGGFDRYYIGYADIFIVKSDSLMPKLIENTGNSFDNISKLSKTDYELELLTRAVDIQKKIISESIGLTECNIAIIDRVYIQKHFRRCKISSWIHQNLADLIKTFGMVDIAAAMIVPGDFANESEKLFGMTKEEYEQLLIKHYKNNGYKMTTNNIMVRRFVEKKKLFGVL